MFRRRSAAEQAEIDAAINRPWGAQREGYVAKIKPIGERTPLPLLNTDPIPEEEFSGLLERSPRFTPNDGVVDLVDEVSGTDSSVPETASTSPSHSMSRGKSLRMAVAYNTARQRERR